MKLSGIFGTGSGKAGSSVFVVRQGENIVRAYQPRVANPRTDRQTATRTRLAFCSTLAKGLDDVLAIGMPQRGLKSPRNAFVKTVIPIDARVISQTSSTIRVEYTVLPVSKGGMPKPRVASMATNTQAGFVSVTLAQPYIETVEHYHYRKAGAAGLVMVLYNPTLGETSIKQLVDVTDPDLAVNYPVSWQGLEAHVYVFGKWVLQSGTIIESGTIPWRYPSDQSDSVFCGTLRTLL